MPRSSTFIRKEGTNQLDTRWDGRVRNEVYDPDALAWVAQVSPGSSLVNVNYDYVSVTYPSATQEVYTFKNGGSGGTTALTVTVNYVDSTKEDLLNVGAV